MEKCICGAKFKTKEQLVKHKLTCKWFAKTKLWNQKVKENEGKIFWYVDTNKYVLKKCVLSDGSLTEMIRFIKEDGSLENYSTSFSKDNLFADETKAQERLDHLNDLYKNTFKFEPYLKENTIEKYKKELIYIEKIITEKLKDFPNFEGIDFCDVGAYGIQIRGHHKQIKGYTYGEQITIKYDFSNYMDCINEFVDMWKKEDTPENVRGELRFIAYGEKYGWD